jgi:HK97 family phage portal protein
MGFLTDLIERRYTLADMDRDMDLSVYPPASDSGVHVTESTALNYADVYACVRVISEDVGSLPFVIYRRLGGKGKERAVDHPLYPLLHDAPNPEMTAMTFRETLTGHVASWGNCYAEIQYDDRLRIVGLWPLRPDRTEPERDKVTRQLQYKVRLPDGKGVILPAYRVLQIPGFGFNGIKGYSPIAMERNAIGLAMAAEKFGNKTFANNARPGMYFKHPNEMSQDAQDRFRKSWEEKHLGLDNVQRLAILEEGMSLETVGFPGADLQFLETRKFQRSQICAIFRMKPHKIADLENATYSNIEQQSLEYTIDTIRPWCVRWEQAVMLKLLDSREKREYFPKHIIEGLLRGDFKSRQEGLAIQRMWGITNADEWRELEDKNPIPNGEGSTYLNPVNMAPVGAAPQQQDGERAGVLPQMVPVYARQESRNSRGAARSGAEARLQTARSFKGVFLDAAGRLVKREVRDLTAAAKKMSGSDFRIFVRDYYEAHPETFRKLMEPAFGSLAEAVQAQAAGEIGGFAGMTRAINECLDFHVDKVAERHCRGALAAINAALAREGRQMDEELYDLIVDELTDWEETVPAALTSWETIRTTGLISKATYFTNEVHRLQWVELDGNRYCKELDGMEIDLGSRCEGSTFVDAGSDVEARADDIFRPSWNVTTSPLGPWCNCMVAAVKD